MKKVCFALTILFSAIVSNGQKIDSIYFHLYTDSLKKGTHNYINVDGKTSTGSWKPLTAKEITFTSTYGEFDGNELILPDPCKVEKLSIKAVLKSNPSIWKEITVWVKKKPDDELLPTKDDVLNGKNGKQKSKN